MGWVIDKSGAFYDWLWGSDAWGVCDWDAGVFGDGVNG